MVDNIFSRLGSLLTHGGGAAHVDPSVRYQTLEGWGTSLAWWGHVVGGWPDARRNEIANLVFSPTPGLGLNVVRYNIGGGDDPAHHHMRLGGAVPGYQPAPGRWDWEADANQRWMLTAALSRGTTISEAFSNSPPYWMTRSGCAAGADDAGNNLRDEHVDSFAAYMAEVVTHFHTSWGVTFRTIEPFNEPVSPHWQSGKKQEGCHVSPELQRAVIARLAAQLAARGITETTVAAPDTYSIDEAVATVGSYDAATLATLTQINTHGYSGTRRADLREVAAARGKRLWMSEYGVGGGAHDHEAIGPALRLAGQIRRDLTELRPAAWVYWQAAEAEEGHNNWGFIHADFGGGSAQYWLTKQYYAMAQYCTFIRPGYIIIDAGDTNTVAAYDTPSGTLVLVCDNDTAEDRPVRYDLSRFPRLATPAAVYRTSATENRARGENIPLADGALATTAKAQSITTCIITHLEA